MISPLSQAGDYFQRIFSLEKVMKKTTLWIALTTFITAGAALAETSTGDNAAVLNIVGNVTTGNASCAVNVSENSISLVANLKDIAPQSAVGGAPAKNVQLNITGNTQCYEMLERNNIAYRFLGTADNADGNVLANKDTSVNAAMGLGVRLADREGNTLSINKDTLLASSAPTRLGFNFVTLNGQTATPGSFQSTLTIEVERL
ncbi:fimbrial protein [Cronobacter dublinensis]|uniref:fimbrial protein n=2 Tax=Cronobacter dublinensis TaxID=413497 RepID=UPI00137559B6|nr:fimbrial protein [Cronobacter dublinensis]EKY3088089.1 fimbrial protein [Cronobacter dublinensis]ELY4007838.1 fimbrial protein [Cronobacter dublinensis]ELY5818086.1 fimbrial protein [Cronobacter dublinensis]MDI7388585.1 fimbrial protein [Cronobacter dublinensis]NCH06442.1 fimbrial protein [Cronobacter dublinensis]